MSASEIDLYITMPRGENQRYRRQSVAVQPRLIAPLARGADVGQLRVFTSNQTLTTVPVHPLTEVAAGGWWRRLIDTIRLWFA